MFNNNKKSATEVFPSLYNDIFTSTKSQFLIYEFDNTLSDNELNFNLCALTSFIIDYTITKINQDDKSKDNTKSLLNISSYYFSQFLSEAHTSDSSSNGNGSIKENIDKLKKFRADHNPPECWYFIFSEVFSFKSPDYFSSEIKKFEEGLKVVNKYNNMDSVQIDCEKKLRILKNEYALFDKSEMKFRQLIRLARKSLLSINLKKVEKDLKAIKTTK